MLAMGGVGWAVVACMMGAAAMPCCAVPECYSAKSGKRSKKSRIKSGIFSAVWSQQ